ncbi:acyltransferase family protein [Bifidobacterium thermophilum]|uniref:acyltransferase family protein n=1 Tax=Bifidobacterium thermophilum TaxID=33905 RepID=UPI0030A1E047
MAGSAGIGKSAVSPQDRRTVSRFRGIDGLRALAIIAIVVYHASPSTFAGGFLGVTVFFVITGFLMTRGIEHAMQSGRFDYAAVIRKRLIRLWPMLLSSIALTVPLIYLFAPSLLPKTQADALPAALFAINWVYIFREVPYFAAAGLPSPFTPLWFTAVIMQFAMVWTALLWLLHRVCRSRAWLHGAVWLMIIASGVAMAWAAAHGDDTARAYYGLDTRAAEMLVGAELALIHEDVASIRDARRAPRMPARLSHALSWQGGLGPVRVGVMDIAAMIALLMLAVGCCTVHGDDAWLYRGGFVGVALLSACIVNACTSAGSLTDLLLGCAPLTAIGSRAFALYLIHYPLLEVMNPATRTADLPWWGWLVEILILVAAAELMFRFVERPLTRTYGARGEASCGHPAEADDGMRGQAPSSARTVSASATPAMPGSSPLRRGFSTTVAEAVSSLRPAARVLAMTGIITAVVLGLVPANWREISYRRAVMLRPEIAERSSSSLHGPLRRRPAASPRAKKPDGHAAASSTPHAGGTKQPSPAPSVTPKAEKIPKGMPLTQWTYDAAAGACSADPLIIGDSVALGAAEPLQQVMPRAIIDAQVSRQLGTASDIYAQHAAAGTAGEAVVVALGDNGPIRDESTLQDIVDAFGGKPVYFLTLRVPVSWQDPNNAVIRSFASHHANVGVIDWYGTSEGHSEYLYDDGTHLTPQGRDAYAVMMRQAFCGQ